MEPIFGFMWFFAACIIVSIVAGKRGRSGWLFFILIAAAGFGLVVLVSNAGGGSVAAGIAAFLAPLIGFVVAVTLKTSRQLAVERGGYGDYLKCPFCAEAIRKEAIKCKHCGSDLRAIAMEETGQVTASQVDAARGKPV